MVLSAYKSIFILISTVCTEYYKALHLTFYSTMLHIYICSMSLKDNEILEHNISLFNIPVGIDDKTT